MTNRPLSIPTSNVVEFPAYVSGPFNVKSIEPMYRTVAGSVTAFANANAPVAVKNVPAPNVNGPVPSGPDVTVDPTAEGVLLAPIINPPAVTFTPPPNVFAPLNAKIPAPDFTNPVVPPFVALLTTAVTDNAATPALFNPFAALNSVLLSGVMAARYVRTRKPMPAVPLALLGGASGVYHATKWREWSQ